MTTAEKGADEGESDKVTLPLISPGMLENVVDGVVGPEFVMHPVDKKGGETTDAIEIGRPSESRLLLLGGLLRQRRATRRIRAGWCAGPEGWTDQIYTPICRTRRERRGLGGEKIDVFKVAIFEQAFVRHFVRQGERAEGDRRGGKQQKMERGLDG